MSKTNIPDENGIPDENAILGPGDLARAVSRILQDRVDDHHLQVEKVDDGEVKIWATR